MTKEERIAKIAELKEQQEFFYDPDMALLIELLEQEPCEDCVDRKEVLKTLYEHLEQTDAFKTYPGMKQSLSDWINEIPSIQPTRIHSKWIDVHDRMPDKSRNKFVLCSFENGHVDVCTIGYLMENERIVAWMPLPKPYEPQESEG